MASALVIIVCIVNIVLWLAFFFKWKKLFSTDEVIAKTKNEIENMIRDLDLTANRDIDLLTAKSEEIKTLLFTLDSKLGAVKAETLKTQKLSTFQKSLSKKTSDKSFDKTEKPLTYKRPRFRDEKIDVLEKSKIENAELNFDDVPQIVFNETISAPKKEISNEIAELSEAGFSVEEIAKRLSCSRTEVEMRLAMQ